MPPCTPGLGTAFRVVDPSPQSGQDKCAHCDTPATGPTQTFLDTRAHSLTGQKCHEMAEPTPVLVGYAGQDTLRMPTSNPDRKGSMGYIPALLASSRPMSQRPDNRRPRPPIASVHFTPLFTPTVFMPHTFFAGTLTSAPSLNKCSNAELKTRYNAGDQLLLVIVRSCINNEN